LFYAPSRGRINNLHAKKRAKVLLFFGLTKYFVFFLKNICLFLHIHIYFCTFAKIEI
jgi:hypothetical protein